MPLNSYTLIHKKAKLSASDKELVLQWIEKMKDILSKKNNNEKVNIIHLIDGLIWVCISATIPHNTSSAKAKFSYLYLPNAS
jgi:hypothetical protein